MRVLFLDFDGVLHPVPAVLTGRVANGKPVLRTRHVLPFEFLPILHELMRPHPDVRLIVHSTWRLAHTSSDLEEMLGVLADRFLGCAPQGARWECIRVSLDMNADICDYRILDDSAEELVDAPPQRVILCDGRTGISEPRVQRRLRDWLEGNGPASRWPAA